MALNIVEMIAYADKADREIHQLREALSDIEDLVEDYIDVDDGQPNLAMKVSVVARLALGKGEL